MSWKQFWDLHGAQLCAAVRILPCKILELHVRRWKPRIGRPRPELQPQFPAQHPRGHGVRSHQVCDVRVSMAGESENNSRPVASVARRT